MPEYQTLIVEFEGPVDWVTLNRPESLNALTDQMISELWDYFSEAERDFSRRVIVLRGAGRGFCAGLDLRAHIAKPADAPQPQGSLPEIIALMRSCPQPIVALVHGPACGGGLAFALASDVRIAGQSARLNDAFVKLGLSGCELGVSYFLPRMVGLSVASELMFTGRFIHADRALAVGLVSQVTPDAEMAAAARALVADMLRASPLGLRKTKETLNQAMRMSDLVAVIDLEQQTQLACMKSDNFQEAVNAFLEKRDPFFTAER